MMNRSTNATFEKQNTKRRKVYLDILRIFAIYMVLFNHTGTKGFVLFTLPVSFAERAVSLFLSILCKAAVPLFYMISGSLLLGKEETTRELYKKRVLKFAVILLVVSVIHWIFYVTVLDIDLTFRSMIYHTYGGGIAPNLWFLFSYMAMLTMLPLLRRLARNMRAAEYHYLALMFLFFIGIVPMAEYLVFHGKQTLSPDLKGALFTAPNIMYTLMGYYFDHIMEPKYRKGKYLLYGVLASAAAIFITAFMIRYQAHVTGEWTQVEAQTFHYSLTMIPAFTIFVGSKTFFEKHPLSDRTRHILSVIGGTSFGIYLFEEILRNLTLPVFDVLQPRLGTLPACLVWVLFFWIVGSFVTYCIKKIPGVSRWI